ncbi:MAG TPA: response regulator transcription factor [Planctomycetota bacterium]|nr:response regulator transcription factor [Planctomycetota bacterium]
MNANPKPLVLVVEDEESMAAGLRYALEREGYDVRLAADGAAAADALRTSAPDLVLLDVMLPRRSGFDLLEQLRRAGRATPVILLTAKGAEADRVRGFDLGADDYVVKPFSLAELLARVRARLRRRAAEGADVPATLVIGDAVVDLAALTLRRGDVATPLTVREADMLRLLWRERGRVVSRGRFLEEVWRQADVTTRTVDQHMAQLRKKLEPDAARPRHLVTVFGVGYRLEP